MSKIKIVLKKSVIGSKEEQKATIKALGLRKINDMVEKTDTPQIRGMINKVSHLIEVQEVK